ncbi:MAG: hypothetical protein ACYSU0_19805 [Planctomycetota bacterium]
MVIENVAYCRPNAGNTAWHRLDRIDAGPLASKKEQDGKQDGMVSEKTASG